MIKISIEIKKSKAIYMFLRGPFDLVRNEKRVTVVEEDD